jgi:hypothetical protein
MRPVSPSRTTPHAANFIDCALKLLSVVGPGASSQQDWKRATRGLAQRR